MQKISGYSSAGLIGVTSVVVFGLAWIFASLSDPSWIFGENMLSDLGVSDVTNAAWFFNGGCFIAGILGMIAGIGMIALRRSYYSAAGVFVTFMGMFLAMVGLFTEDTGDIHTYVAVTFFVLALLAMITMTAGDWKEGHVLYGGVTILLLAFVLVIGLTDTKAYFETMGVIAILVWFALHSIKFIVIKYKVNEG